MSSVFSTSFSSSSRNLFRFRASNQYMNVIANGFVFTAALALGIFASSLVWPANLLSTALVRTPSSLDVPAPLTARSLIGTWRGTWGYDDGECTLEISRADGNTFYGTLRKQGAAVRFVGDIDPGTRRLHLVETKVLSLGANMSKWSLGTNLGMISQDGRIMVGTGEDEWGEYPFAASNY
jgi:hypothetical protein